MGAQPKKKILWCGGESERERRRKLPCPPDQRPCRNGWNRHYGLVTAGFGTVGCGSGCSVLGDSEVERPRPASQRLCGLLGAVSRLYESILWESRDPRKESLEATSCKAFSLCWLV